MTNTPSSTERVQAYRARKKAEGAVEIRGIFAPADHHDAIKAGAKAIAAAIAAAIDGQDDGRGAAPAAKPRQR